MHAAALLLIAWSPDLSWLPLTITRSAEEKQLLQAIDSMEPKAWGYEELQRKGVRNPLLYRNLGNTFMKYDRLPLAILAYRRGLRLNPADRELQELLALARSNVTYDRPGFGRPAADNRPPWLPRLASGWFIGAAFALYGIACLFWTRWLMTRRAGLRTWGTIALLLAGLLGAAIWWDDRQLQHDREPPLVVVIEDGVLLRKGNALTYPARYDTPLNRGVEARLRHDGGDWLQVELGSGEIGWLHRAWVVVDLEQ